MLIRSFLNYTRFEKRYSPHTVKSYENDLDQFVEFLSSNYGNVVLSEVGSYHVRSFLVWLMDSGCKASSVKRKLSTLNSFYKYLLRESKVDKSPMVGISGPKQAKRLPSFIAESDMSKITAPDIEEESGFVGMRNRLIVELLYLTGIRRAELIGITDSSFKNDYREVKVLGKRNKERIIPLHDSIRNMIRRYVELRDTHVDRVEECFFVTEKGKKMYPKLVYNIVKQKLEGATTLQKKSPHVLRHTFATHLLNKGADINAIKELLGHSNLASTQVYTHNTIEKLKNVHKQAHPKS